MAWRIISSAALAAHACASASGVSGCSARESSARTLPSWSIVMTTERNRGHRQSGHGPPCGEEHQSPIHHDVWRDIGRSIAIFAYRWPGLQPRRPTPGAVRPMEASRRFELPRLPHLAMHALPRVIEGMIAPAVVFYAGLAALGLNGAIMPSIAWVYGGILIRVVRREHQG